MNLQSVLLTSIAIATVAWVMAFDAQAQTRPPQQTAQITLVQSDNAGTPAAMKH